MHDLCVFKCIKNKYSVTLPWKCHWDHITNKFVHKGHKKITKGHIKHWSLESKSISVML